MIQIKEYVSANTDIGVTENKGRAGVRAGKRSLNDRYMAYRLVD